MPKTLPLYNQYFFKTLLQEMERANTYFIIDGNETLWHVDDILQVLEQYQTKEVINNN